MNIIKLLVAAAVGLSAPAGAGIASLNESVSEPGSGISWTVTSDYASVTLSMDGDAFSDENVRLTLRGVDQNISVPAEKTFDNLWMASCDLDGFYGKPVEFGFENGHEEYWTEQVTIPQLTESTGRPDGLSFAAADQDGNTVEFTAQPAKGREYLFLPSGADLSGLQVFYDETVIQDMTYSFALGSTESYPLTSGGVMDLSEPDSFINSEALFVRFLYKRNGMDETYVLGVMQSRNLASLFVTSDDPLNQGRLYVEASSDHSVSAPASVTLYDSTFSQEYSGSNAQIKGRGNTTWLVAKKPYQIKLNKKADLLDPADGKQKAKKWLLLSNPFDSTLLHNRVAMNTAHELGMKETPEGRSIDLYYDGEYRGSYYLCEKNEINENRVDIHNLEDDIEDANKGVDLDSLAEAEDINSRGFSMHYVTGLQDPENITGGYLLEIDSVFYGSEKSWFKTEIGTFVSKQPEYLSRDAITYISDFMGEVLSCTQNPAGVSATGKTVFDYLDRDTFVKYWLMQEWVKNNDAFTSSTFFFKPQDEDKLYAGPLWDCDASIGTRSGVENPYGWHNVGWAKFWYYFHEAFREALKTTYANEFRPLLETVLYGSEDDEYSLAHYIDEIRYSKTMNFTLWDYRPDADFFDAYKYEWQNMDFMVKWLRNRTAWMDRELLGENTASVYRIAGETRYETSLKIAEYLRRQTASGVFDNVIIASGDNYPDALCSGYLSSELNAPVILIGSASAAAVTDYLNSNMAEDGKVYVLGGEKAVADEWLKDLGYETVRLAGADRFETNMEIVRAVDNEPESVIVCTGTNYADCLSASALDLPVLLVSGEHLTDEQKEWLDSLELKQICIAGGPTAVSESILTDLNAYGSAARLEGETRFHTSRKIADTFFKAESLKNAVTAYGYDFPDGLCGGALARALNAPILLADSSDYSQAQEYFDETFLEKGYVLGGEARIADPAVKDIFGLGKNDTIYWFE